jgi:hypothetical protein
MNAKTAEAVNDLRLARLHLRVGMLPLALAELEDLERRSLLADIDRSYLAEARWRAGEFDGAAAAARRHLEAGGEDPVAMCIAAEAAAADGRPGEARTLMDRLGPPDAATLDALFAGMPRRAFWPSVSGEASDTHVAETLFEELGRSPLRREERAARPYPRPEGGPPRERESAVPGPRDVLDATEPQLWAEGSSAGAADPEADRKGRAPRASARPPNMPAALDRDPVAELARARAELSRQPEQGLLRLALTLRLDPTLAPAVLDLVAGRTDPLAAMLRGDAQRLLGRHLEAEVAFASAAAGLGEERRKPRS